MRMYFLLPSLSPMQIKYPSSGILPAKHTAGWSVKAKVSFPNHQVLPSPETYPNAFVCPAHNPCPLLSCISAI